MLHLFFWIPRFFPSFSPYSPIWQWKLKSTYVRVVHCVTLIFSEKVGSRYVFDRSPGFMYKSVKWKFMPIIKCCKNSLIPYLSGITLAKNKTGSIFLYVAYMWVWNIETKEIGQLRCLKNTLNFTVKSLPWLLRTMHESSVSARNIYMIFTTVLFINCKKVTGHYSWRIWRDFFQTLSRWFLIELVVFASSGLFPICRKLLESDAIFWRTFLTWEHATKHHLYSRHVLKSKTTKEM